MCASNPATHCLRVCLTIGGPKSSGVPSGCIMEAIFFGTHQSKTHLYMMTAYGLLWGYSAGSTGGLLWWDTWRNPLASGMLGGIHWRATLGYSAGFSAGSTGGILGGIHWPAALGYSAGYSAGSIGEPLWRDNVHIGLINARETKTIGGPTKTNGGPKKISKCTWNKDKHPPPVPKQKGKKERKIAKPSAIAS